MDVVVRKPSEKEKKEAVSWPIWTKSISEFDWEYSDKETCLILEGEAKVVFGKEQVSFKAGDYVIFPEGLSCRWVITKPIKKHYNFG